MKKIIWVIVATTIIWFASTMNASASGAIVPEGFEKNSDVKNKGTYINANYCYSIELPEGVIGLTSSQPVSQHGVGIVIGQGDDSAFLMVEGDPGSWLDDPDNGGQRSLENIIKFKKTWLAKDNVTILKENIVKGNLGELRANNIELVVRPYDSDKEIYYKSISALSKSGTYYEVYLRSSKNRYSQGLNVYEKIVKSWKLMDKAECNKAIKVLIKQ